MELFRFPNHAKIERGVMTQSLTCIPGSRQNPKMLWVYDTKVVRDRIAEFLPVFWDILTQEGERLVGEFPECGVILVVRHMLVHRAP